MGGEYTANVIQEGLLGFLEKHAPALLGNRPPLPDRFAGSQLTGSQGFGRSRTTTPAGFLHRLSRAADLRRHETG